MGYRVFRQIQHEHQPAQFVIYETSDSFYLHHVSVDSSNFQQIVVGQLIMPEKIE